MARARAAHHSWLRRRTVGAGQSAVAPRHRWACRVAERGTPWSNGALSRDVMWAGGRRRPVAGARALACDFCECADLRADDCVAVAGSLWTALPQGAGGIGPGGAGLL